MTTNGAGRIGSCPVDAARAPHCARVIMRGQPDVNKKCLKTVTFYYQILTSFNSTVVVRANHDQND